MGQPVLPSTTLLNAEIGFLKTRLALIRIPVEIYPLYVQPILNLLLHNKQLDEDGNILHPSRPWHYWLPFVNISLTPKECSIVCPRDQAESLFMIPGNGSRLGAKNEISINHDDYSVIMIGGEGLEAGQRVLDLTGPLALAGIPILFITSYYSDFILVPLSARGKVIHALEDRGFVFQANDSDGESGQMTNPASPLTNPHQRNISTSSSGFFEFPPLAVTPPPTSISELQAKTFRLLARHNIVPHVDRSTELVTCAGIKDSTPAVSLAHFSHGKFQLGLTRCLTSSPPPRFFSLTLTDSESASLTLETRLLEYFPGGGDNVLLGHEGSVQIPITLDFRELPRESAGIVAGVASRLTEGMKGRIGREMFNMSYLSTSRAGHVIVYDDELDDAMDALRGIGMNGEDGLEG